MMTIYAATGGTLTIPITTQSGDYAAAAGDALTQIRSTSATAVTFTLNENVFVAGDWLEICQFGAGQATIAAGSGVTIDSPAGLVHTHQQYSTARVLWISPTEVELAGDLA